MKSNALKPLNIKKDNNSVKIKAQYISRLMYHEPNDEVTGPLWRSHVISFLLTKISAGGIIFAEWEEKEKSVIWRYDSEANSSYGLANLNEVLFTQDLRLFRSIIGNFGMDIMNGGSIGAGIFFLNFYDNKNDDVCFSCMFSNMKETGYWIRLQNIDK